MPLTKVTYSMIDGGVVYADDYGAIGNGATDDLTALQAAVNAVEASGGGTVFLDPSKIYAVSGTLDLGVSGTPVFLDGQARTGAAIKALSGFTGGCIRITQGGVRNMRGLGFDKDTIGHSFIQFGSPSQYNPLIEIRNVQNDGGFWDFIKTVYEFDNAVIDMITSNVAVGRSVLSLQTDLAGPAGISYSASPSITRLSLRNPESTPVSGSKIVTGIYLDGVENAVLSGLISNFSACVSIGSNVRGLDAKDLLVLDLRSTPSNNLWEDAWAATTAYSTGKYIKPTVSKANGWFYIASTGGTTGAAEPTWPTTLGATVVDGTVTWLAVNTSINISIGNAQQASFRNIRSEAGIVAFQNAGNANLSFDSCRLVGESMAYLNTATSGNSELVSSNGLYSGDIKLVNGGVQTRFYGMNNLIVSDTLAQVPSHEFSGYSWMHTYKAISAGNAINGTVYVDIADGVLKFKDYSGSVHSLY